MVISTGLFIDGRVGELDLIRAGWLFMHRTMTNQDRMRFEQMINTPGFCVKKFEEMFLLRRINPFAPSEEQRIIMFDHSDCACKNAQDVREISEMKKQLGEFLAKWEDVFKQLPLDLTSSDSLHKIDDLQQQTTERLIQMKLDDDLKDDIKEHTVNQETEENGSKERLEKKTETQENELETNVSKENISYQDVVKESTTENFCTSTNADQKSDMKKIGDIEVVDSEVNNDSSVQDMKTEKQNTHQTKAKKGNIDKKSSNQEKTVEKEISAVEKEKENKESIDTPNPNKPAVKTQKTEPSPHHGNAVAEQCVWNVAHVSGKPTQPKLQYSQAAASGVTKSVEKELSPPKKSQQTSMVVEQKLTNPKLADVNTSTPTLPVEPTQSAKPNLEQEITVTCAEVKADVPMTICTDISPAITDNSRSAGTPDSGMISDISEVKPAELEADSNEKETSKSKDPEKLTGRDARRYRQKLREAEKAALAQVVKVEAIEDMEETERENVGSDVTEVETENATPTGKERRRQKDKLRKEKKEQEKLLKQSEPAEVDSGVSASNVVSTPEKSADGNNDVSNVSEYAVNETDVRSEEPIASVEEVTNSEVVEDKSEESSEEVTPEDDDKQGNKLSKSQKKRAQKKAAKGVYVVNDNRSHSIELLPGEYKIVQLDKDRNIQEIEFVNGVERKVNEGESDEKKNGGVVVKPLKKSVKNLLAASNISKEILDKGKWLAYVIDEQNPNAVPKIGEVSTVDVAKTIKMLDSQVSSKKTLQQDGYIDDLDYSCTKGPGDISTTVSQIIPEFDADLIRENFSKRIECDEPGCYAGPTDEEIATQPPVSDLQLMINQEPGFKFHTELAKRTSPLLIGNDEFREFCRKYSKSKYDNGVISALVKKYIDTRVVFHFKRFKKFADREALRISRCWTKVTDSSPFALMLMLYINNPTSNVGFGDIEAVLFPSP